MEFYQGVVLVSLNWSVRRVSWWPCLVCSVTLEEQHHQSQSGCRQTHTSTTSSSLETLWNNNTRVWCCEVVTRYLHHQQTTAEQQSNITGFDGAQCRLCSVPVMAGMWAESCFKIRYDATFQLSKIFWVIFSSVLMWTFFIHSNFVKFCNSVLFIKLQNQIELFVLILNVARSGPRGVLARKIWLTLYFNKL